MVVAKNLPNLIHELQPGIGLEFAVIFHDITLFLLISGKFGNKWKNEPAFFHVSSLISQ
jgi:hypothetical protein